VKKLTQTSYFSLRLLFWDKLLAPFSLRLTVDERAKLEDLAGDMSLSAFIKEHLFRSGPHKSHKMRRRRRKPIKDQKLLAQLLAILGKSRLSQNMNQLARASNSGSLPLISEVEKELRQACADIKEMRLMLMNGLGLYIKPDKKSDSKTESFRQAFIRASTDVKAFRS